MAAGGVLSCRRRLESFVRDRVAESVDWFEESLTWPPEALAMVSCSALSGFQWLGVRVADEVRLFGIRPLIEEPFFSIAQLEKEGFELDSTEHPHRIPSDIALGHYWVAEVISPTQMVVCECAFAAPRTWYVLNEHVFWKRPQRQLPRLCLL